MNQQLIDIIQNQLCFVNYHSKMPRKFDEASIADFSVTQFLMNIRSYGLDKVTLNYNYKILLGKF